MNNHILHRSHWSSALSLLLFFGSSSAMANQELAQKKNCLGCHAVEKKVIGPSYKEVAAKYAGQKDALSKLSQKVILGSKGTWGPMPMPANPQVSEAEAKQLVQWILSQK